MAWFDNDWQYRVLIEIPATSVTSAHTNFPAYLDLSTMPAGFWEHVKSDGSDIRFTEDDEVTEIPFEVVSIDTGGETGEVWFLTQISDSSTDAYYIYYGNPSASAYANSDPFGSGGVWTDYNAVFHMAPTTHYKGIEIGIDVASSDIGYTLNTFAGAANNGEVTITGTTLVDKNSVSRTVGSLNSGLALDEDNANDWIGFVMWSDESVHTRFSTPPHGSNADHFIAVIYDGGAWKADCNGTLETFTPEPDDLLIARMRWGATTVKWAYEIAEATLDSCEEELATSVGSPVPVAGKFGSAYEFDPANPDFFVLDDPTGTTGLSPTTEAGLITISWTNPTTGISSGYVYSSRGWNNGASSVYNGFNQYYGATGQMGYSYGSNTGTGSSGRRTWQAGQSPDYDAWNYWYTRMASNTTVTFSLDGVEDTGVTTSGTATNLVNNASNEPTIGSSGQGAFPFEGMIDEVRIRTDAIGSSQYDWHADEYLNQNDPESFYVLDDEEHLQEIYTAEEVAALPTDDADLANAIEVDQVNEDDDTYYDDLQADQYIVHQFKFRNTDSTSEVTINWKGKTDVAPTSSTVYLQVYNRDTSTWETIDSDNSSAVNTEFVLTGVIDTDLADYYDSYNTISARVYQETQ